MKKYLLFSVFLLLLIGSAHSRLQIEKVKPEQPQVLSILTVLSPNGGEIWDTGTKCDIRWASKNVQGNVKIILKWPGGQQIITNNTQNTGSFKWPLPADFYHEGDLFRIHIMTLDEKVKDASNKYFSIKKREIIVLHPKGGEELTQGSEYNIIWLSKGRIPRVKIDVEDEKGVKHRIAETQNSEPNQSFRWTVSPLLRPEKYKLTIFSLDGIIKDESNGTFDIIPPPVELTCGLGENKNFSDQNYGFFTIKNTKYFQFEVFIKNNGTQILNRVPVMWTILKQPLNDVVVQSEAGFGNVYPNRRYWTTFKFKYNEKKLTWVFLERNKIFENGDYKFVFEVDPRNELHEPDWARDNNKLEVFFKIE